MAIPPYRIHECATTFQGVGVMFPIEPLEGFVWFSIGYGLFHLLRFVYWWVVTWIMRGDDDDYVW